MRNMLLTILSYEWAGLVLAAAIGVVGAACWFGDVAFARDLGAILLVAAAALTIGACIHLLRLARTRRRFPPRGKMIDIGGYRVHVFAEGTVTNHPPVVWFGGGHAAGAVMDHLHRNMRDITRSILIDRPGSWRASVWAALHCAVGDGAIAFFTLFVALAVVSIRRVRTVCILATITLLLGLVTTSTIEVLSTQWLMRWAYGPLMPIEPLSGIGVSPLAKWVVVPAAALALVRRRLSQGLKSISSRVARIGAYTATVFLCWEYREVEFRTAAYRQMAQVRVKRAVAESR